MPTATPKVQVVLNPNRHELKREGWAKTRYARSMQPAQLAFDIASAAVKFQASGMPSGLWKEPNTGVIMMEPSTMQPAYFEESAWDTFKIALDDLDHHALQGFVQSRQTVSPFVFRIEPKRDDINYEFKELVEDAPRVGLKSYLASDMVWLLRTKLAFIPNEGFTAWIFPPGIYTDRATVYLVLSFGKRYALEMRMNGTASLWLNSPVGSATWVEVANFHHGMGAVDHGRPFQVTVIPWGYEYITFLFTQASSSRGRGVQPTKLGGQVAFLYTVSEHEAFPPLDPVTKQYIKVPTDNLHIAVRLKQLQYNFAFARVRYGDPITPQTPVPLYVLPEQLGRPKPVADPLISYRGFVGQLDNVSSGFPAAIQPAFGSKYFANQQGSAWDKTTDTQLVTGFNFVASEHGVYTPELWSEDIEIPADIQTPDWDFTTDVSANWCYARFALSVIPDVNKIQVKLEEYSSAVPDIFKLGGPIQINVRDRVGTLHSITDGYTFRKMPTLIGPKAIAAQQFDARDMWTRVNETNIGNSTTLDGKSILNVLVYALKRPGFDDSDIHIDDPDGRLANTFFGGFSDPNDQKQVNSDSSCGDLIREIIKWYCDLHIRVRWRGDSRWSGCKWNIYLAPQYDPSTPPTIKFLFRTKDSAAWDDDSGVSDDFRWAAHEYLMLSDPELTMEEPEFNELVGKATTGSDVLAMALESIIPVDLADHRSIDDPTYVNYMGRLKAVIKGPPELAIASSQLELDQIIRHYWNTHRFPKRGCEVRGEWQPEIDADTFVWAIGVKRETDGSVTRVSYGAYRVEHGGVELDYDPGSGRSEGNWSFEANYSLIYVGTATDHDTPMITTATPEPMTPTP